MEELLALAQGCQKSRASRLHLARCAECADEVRRLRESFEASTDTPVPALQLPALTASGPSFASRLLVEFFGTGACSDEAFVAAHPRLCAFLGLEPGLNLAQLTLENPDV